MKTRNVLLMICTCCILGCNERGVSVSESETVISIIPKEDDLSPFDLSPYLDTVKFVKLELTDESIIGSLDKVIIYEERIYILGTQTHSLFVFDMEGNYLHKIAKVGQGPGEYLQLDFFDIDRENKHIVLTDLNDYWVMRYDFDGNFLSKQKIPVWCEGVSVLPNKGIVLYANFRNNSDKLEQENNLIYLDSDMQVKKACFPYHSKDFNGKGISTSVAGQFYAFEEHLNFSFPRGSKVYQIIGDSLITKYQFDFGKDMLSIENPVNPEQVRERYNRGRINGLSAPIMENEQLLFFEMSTNVDFPWSIRYQVYYSKESGNTLSGYSFNFEETYHDYSIRFQTGYGSWIVSEIQSYSLVGWRQNYLERKTASTGICTKQLLSIAEELTEDDNSVLMFYKLKPF